MVGKEISYEGEGIRKGPSVLQSLQNKTFEREFLEKMYVRPTARSMRPVPTLAKTFY